MGELISNGSKNGNGTDGISYQNGDILGFDNIDAFSKAVETLGFTLDFSSVIELNTDFTESSDKYLLCNVKEYGADDLNNLLFLTEKKAYIYSKDRLRPQAIQAFEDVLAKPFGKSTVLCFLTLNKVLDNHKLKLEAMVQKIRALEDKFDMTEYRNMGLEFDRLSDRLEEFYDLLIRLQERSYRQMDTQYISFDYRVLLAESVSLQRRCRRRLNTLKELRQDYEMRATDDLNKKIVNLNDIVKKLTALTVIFMIPTVISSHFGMNFHWMPELSHAWVYPTVIAVQVILVIAGIIIFRKMKWL